MAGNRLLYNALGLYASQVDATGVQTGANTIKQLTRVQSFSEDFSRNLTDINQFGNLAAIDRLDVEGPTVSSSFSYYITDLGNEARIGLTVATGVQPLISCVSGVLSKATDVKNYYLLVVDEGAGQDASTYTGPLSGIVAIGNASITSYSMNFAVGDIPSADISVEGLQWRTYADADGTNDVPAINPSNGQSLIGVPFVLPQHQTNAYATQPAALLPGDIVFAPTGMLGATEAGLNVQSVTLSFDLSRTPINKLGSRYAFAREIDFPVTATVAVESEIRNFDDSNLASLLCQTGTLDLQLILKKNSCSGNGAAAATVQFRGAKVVSQNFDSSIGSNATFSVNYEVQIGAANDLQKGIFFSGTYL